jgi:hypothetical protein
LKITNKQRKTPELNQFFVAACPSNHCPPFAQSAPCPSTFVGLSCLSSSGVIRLDLSNKSLSGTVASEIALLASLTYLNLAQNSITGALGTRLTTLSRLSELCDGVSANCSAFLTPNFF